MTAAEAMVLGMAVALCAALLASRATLPSRTNVLLTVLAAVAIVAVMLRRCAG